MSIYHLLLLYTWKYVFCSLFVFISVLWKINYLELILVLDDYVKIVAYLNI